MNCEQAEALLGDLYLGSGSETASSDRVELQAHVGVCASCRGHEVALNALKSRLRTNEEAAAALSQDRVARLRERILEDVASEPAREMVVDGRAWFGPWRAIGAAAAVAVILAGTLWLQNRPGTAPEARPAGSVDTPVVATVAEPSTAGAEIAPIEEAAAAPEVVETLADLRAEFDDRLGGVGVDEAFADRVERARGRSMDAKRQAAAELLLGRVYGELGDQERAREAQKRYLDAVEASEGVAAAARAARKQGDAAFRDRADLLVGLGWYDLVLSRYTESVEAAYAQYMVGQYYERIDEPSRAVVEYQRLAISHPESVSARHGRREIVRLYYNMGEYDRAYAELDASRGEGASAEDRAYAHLKMGMMKYGQGAVGYAAAAREFHAIVREHPDHTYVASAERMLGLMTAEMRSVLGADGNEDF